MKTTKKKVIKEPPEVRKERIRLAKSTSEKVIPKKTPYNRQKEKKVVR